MWADIIIVINAALPAMVAMKASTLRFKGSRLFAMYLLTVSISGVYALLDSYDYQTYLITALVSQVACLIAVGGVLPKRSLLTILPIAATIGIYLFVDFQYKPMLMQAPLLMTILSTFLIKNRGFVINGWLVWGVSTVGMYATMLTFPETVSVIGWYISPLVFTGMCLFWLWHTTAPELVKVWDKVISRHCSMTIALHAQRRMR